MFFLRASPIHFTSAASTCEFSPLRWCWWLCPLVFPAAWEAWTEMFNPLQDAWQHQSGTSSGRHWKPLGASICPSQIMLFAFLRKVVAGLAEARQKLRWKWWIFVGGGRSLVDPTVCFSSLPAGPWTRPKQCDYSQSFVIITGEIIS